MGDSSQNVFDKLLANHAILIRIFKCLKFEDQLKLSQTNYILQNIFVRHIWPIKYRVMEIFDSIPVDGCIVMNETKSHLLALDTDVFQEFLRYYGKDVEHLIERRQCQLYERITCIAENFPYLTHLDLGKRDMEQKPLEFVAKHLRNLKYLRVFIKTTGDIQVQESLETECLLQMPELNHLILEGDINVVLSLKMFSAMASIMKLEKLILGVVIQLKATDNLEILEGKADTLKELDIILSPKECNSTEWLRNLSQSLKNFHSLRSLNFELQRPHVITSETLQIICQECKNLKKFNIFNSCLNVESFPLACSVNELGVNSCQSLKFQNLMDIIKHSNLNKFTCLRTLYEKCLINVKSQETLIFPALEVLACDEWCSHFMKHIFKGSSQLKELQWHRTVANDNDIAQDGRLVECTNLHTLDWHGVMPLETLEKLQHLTKLIISVPIEHIAVILKLSSLQELFIRKIWSSSNDKGIGHASAFPTNLQSLKITRSIMLSMMDFWLELLELNVQLQLTCIYLAREFTSNDLFLKNLIGNPYFPPDLQTIDIWGYNISIQNLKQNYENTTLKIQHDIAPFKNVAFKDMQLIVLRRNL